MHAWCSWDDTCPNQQNTSRVFFEETSLVANPPVPFDDLKRRLYQRLDSWGTKVRARDTCWSRHAMTVDKVLLLHHAYGSYILTFLVFDHVPTMFP